MDAGDGGAGGSSSSGVPPLTMGVVQVGGSSSSASGSAPLRGSTAPPGIELATARLDEEEALAGGFTRQRTGSHWSWSWSPPEPEGQPDKRGGTSSSDGRSKKRRGTKSLPEVASSYAALMAGWGSSEREQGSQNEPLAAMLVATEPIGKSRQAWLVRLESSEARARQRSVFLVGVVKDGLDRREFLCGNRCPEVPVWAEEPDPAFEREFCGRGSSVAGSALGKGRGLDPVSTGFEHFLLMTPWYRRMFGPDPKSGSELLDRDMLVVADGWHRNLLIFVQGMDCGSPKAQPCAPDQLSGEPWQRSIRIQGDFRLAVVLGKTCRAQIQEVSPAWAEHFRRMIAPPPPLAPRPTSFAEEQDVEMASAEQLQPSRRSCGSCDMAPRVVQLWRWPAEEAQGPAQAGERVPMSTRLKSGVWSREYVSMRRETHGMWLPPSERAHAEGLQALRRLLLDRAELPHECRAFVRGCASWRAFRLRACAGGRRPGGSLHLDAERCFRDRLLAKDIGDIVSTGFARMREWQVLGTHAVDTEGPHMLDRQSVERILCQNPPLLGATGGQGSLSSLQKMRSIFFDTSFDLYRGVHEVPDMRLHRDLEFRLLEGQGQPSACIEARDVVHPWAMLQVLWLQVRYPPSEIECAFRQVPPNQLRGMAAVPPDLEPGLTAPVFGLADNSGDRAQEQPPHFGRWPLRPDQCRSLGWMIRREEEDVPLVVEYRCHTSPLSMDLEHNGLVFWGGVTDVRVQAKYEVRGGILGDAIGYGKTATMIGLIDSRLGAPMPSIPASEREHFFATRATLVLCPGNLVGQWEQEFEKFIGKGTLRVLVIRTVTQLRNATVRLLQEVDVVICSYRLLYSPIYQERVRQFLGAAKKPTLKERRGRPGPDRGVPASLSHFDARLPVRETLDFALLRQRTAQLIESPARLRRLGIRQGSKAQSIGELDYPLLEQFWWRRVVFDEFHELEAFGPSQQGSLQFLRGHFRWGLTGTPPTDSVRHVVFMASLFRVDLAGKSADALRCADWQHAQFEEQRHQREPYWRTRHRRAESAARQRRCRYCRQFQGSLWNFIDATTARWYRSCPTCHHSWMISRRRCLTDSMDLDDDEDTPPSLSTAAVAEEASSIPRDHRCGRPECVLCGAGEGPSLDDEFWGLEDLENEEDFSDEELSESDFHYGESLFCVDVYVAFLHLAEQHLEVVDKATPPSRTPLHTWEADPVLARNCRAFVDTMVRQNTATVPIRTEEHLVPVRHTVEERAIYLQQARDAACLLDEWEAEQGGEEEEASAEVAADEEKKARLKRSQRLLQLCSHFSAHARADGNAKQECQRLRDRLERRISAAKTKADRSICALELLSRGFEAVRGQPPTGGPGRAAYCAMLEALDTSKEAHLQQVADFARQAFEESAGLIGRSLFVRAVPLEVRQKQVSDPSPSLTKALQAFSGMPRPGERAGLGEEAERDAKALRQAERVKRQEHDTLITEAWEVLRKHLTEVKEAAMSLHFFTTTMRLLQQDTEARSCSVCMSDNIPLQRLAITPCSHVFCVHCMKLSMAHAKQCPLCRASIDVAEVQPLALELLEERTAEDPQPQVQPGSQLARFGSKLCTVAATLREVLAGDTTVKVIVFVQWYELQVCVRSALAEFGIPCAVLQGNVYARTSTITAFQQMAGSGGRDSGPRVLLLSLEGSASGTNLTAAHHVFFIHPMNALSEAQAVAYELQAVGRVRRWGQERNCVHIWRFVTLDTIEESLTRKHRQGIWQAFQQDADRLAAADAAAVAGSWQIIEGAGVASAAEAAAALDAPAEPEAAAAEGEEASMAAGDILACRRRCVEAGFSAFVVRDGHAHFQAGSGQDVQRRLKHGCAGSSVHVLVRSAGAGAAGAGSAGQPTVGSAAAGAASGGQAKKKGKEKAKAKAKAKEKSAIKKRPSGKGAQGRPASSGPSAKRARQAR